MNIEIVNYGDDYKFNPVPDANYFSWGVKVKAGGSTAFLAGDINNYDGDEDRLSGMIGHVDLLKLAHHGLSGSNTPSYLTALSPRTPCRRATAAIFPNTRPRPLTGSASATSPRRKRRRTDTGPSWPRSREMACI